MPLNTSIAQRLLLAGVGALLIAGVAGAAVHQDDGDEARAADQQNDQRPRSGIAASSTSEPSSTSLPADPSLAATTQLEPLVPLTGASGAPATSPDATALGSGLAASGNGSVASGTAPLAATGDQPLALPGALLLMLGGASRVVLRAATRRPV